MKLTKAVLASVLMLPMFGRAQDSATQGIPAAMGTTGANPASTPAVLGSAGLSPGDLIAVHLYDFPDVQGELQLHVSAEGTIHLPYAGTLHAAGLTPAQLEQAIIESLKNKQIVKEPNVTVQVMSAVNLVVTVMGQVTSPRSIPLYAPAPISYVLGQVGGITGLASPHITILHAGEQPPTSVDYDPDLGNGREMNTMVQPGDIVNVSPRGVYFVAGEVNRPGIFPLGGALNAGQVTPSGGMGMLKEITLLQALAQAGGITAIAARSKMHILRTVDGKREDIVVDQVKLSKGEVADPILHANDIVYLPPSYIRQQTNNLFATALSGLYAAASIRTSGIY